MADYDPRTDTVVPTEPVGSLPRPAKLQEAYAKFDAGDIGEADLQKLQDEAAKDSVERMEATGSPIVSDGEQRWSSFATYPIATTLAGVPLASVSLPSPFDLAGAAAATLLVGWTIRRRNRQFARVEQWADFASLGADVEARKATQAADVEKAVAEYEANAAAMRTPRSTNPSTSILKVLP